MADVSMLLVGDTNVGRPDPDSAFVPVQRWLDGYDIKFCNLETIISDHKYVSQFDRSPLPRTEEWMFESYLKAGFNIMNEANNPHTYHGYEPLLRSLEVLDSYGVVHGGSGRNLAEARKPAIIERNGTKVAFVCRTSVGEPQMAAGPDVPGVARYPIYTSYEPSARVHSNPGLLPVVHTLPDRGEHRAMLEEDIRAAREQADVVIVSWHWGLSPYQVHPHAGPGDVEVMEYQKEMGHFSIDAGADMVIGHHSHQPQPIEVYNGKPIFYSLANFVHDLAGMGARTFMAYVVRCQLRDNKIHRLSFVPGLIQGHGPPDLGRPSQQEAVVQRLIGMSAPFGTKFDVGTDDVEIVLA